MSAAMTEQQREAEYERFLEAYPDRLAIPRVSGFAFPQCDGWMRRADIAHAEQAEMQAEIDRLRAAAAQSNAEVCQTLGKALGYQWFKDDQANFPGATEADGVCVGEHVAETIACEAAKEIDRLRERVRELAKGYLRTLLTLVCDRSKCTETTAWRRIKKPQPGSVSEALLQLAHEAGVWFDDDGNEVPLDVWKGMVGT